MRLAAETGGIDDHEDIDNHEEIQGTSAEQVSDAPITRPDRGLSVNLDELLLELDDPETAALLDIINIC
jgi:hypothetical protein